MAGVGSTHGNATTPASFNTEGSLLSRLSQYRPLNNPQDGALPDIVWPDPTPARIGRPRSFGAPIQFQDFRSCFVSAGCGRLELHSDGDHRASSSVALLGGQVWTRGELLESQESLGGFLVLYRPHHFISRGLHFGSGLAERALNSAGHLLMRDAFRHGPFPSAPGGQGNQNGAHQWETNCRFSHAEGCPHGRSTRDSKARLVCRIITRVPPIIDSLTQPGKTNL